MNLQPVIMKGVKMVRYCALANVCSLILLISGNSTLVTLLHLEQPSCIILITSIPVWKEGRF